MDNEQEYFRKIRQRMEELEKEKQERIKGTPLEEESPTKNQTELPYPYGVANPWAHGYF